MCICVCLRKIVKETRKEKTFEGKESETRDVFADPTMYKS